jgi:hypothetical protein
MKLTQEELNGFPLQAGIRGGEYFEINLVEDGKRLIITCDSIAELPFEYLRYGGHVYRFESLETAVVPGVNEVVIDLCYKAT